MRARNGLWVAAICLSVGGLEAQGTRARVGIGVSLNPAAIIAPEEGVFLPIGLGNIYVPINVGRSLRIEPEVGLFRNKFESNGTGFTESETVSILRAGVGVFYVFRVDGAFRGYIGPRVGMIRTSEESKFTGSPASSTKRTDRFYGFAVAGEHFFSSHFSLGAEAQLNYITFGDEETDPPPPFPPSGESSQNAITNNGLIFVRFYLGAAGAARAQSSTSGRTSPGAALAVSLAGTLIPVAAGFAMWSGGRTLYDPEFGFPEGPDRSGPALVIASGLVVGPALGYIVGGRTGRGLAGASVRAYAVLISFIPALAICGWDCTQGDRAYDTAWLVVATGAGLAAGAAVYDLVRLPRTLESRRRSAVAVVPVYSHGPGVALRVTF